MGKNVDTSNSKVVIIIILIIMLSFFIILPWADSQANFQRNDLLFNLRLLPLEDTRLILYIYYLNDATYGSADFYFKNKVDIMDSVEIDLPKTVTLINQSWWIYDIYGPSDYRYEKGLVLYTNSTENGIVIKPVQTIQKNKWNRLLISFYTKSKPKGELGIGTLNQLSNYTEIKVTLNTNQYTCKDFCFESNLEI